VLLDQPIFDFHHLNEIHLLAVGRVVRVFPYDFPAIGKVPASVELPGLGLARGEYFKKSLQFVVTVADACSVPIR
jgi:hypothetical protein